MSSKESVADFQKTVLTYWKRNGRHALPWRKTHDPYKILVSEIMLQQTQVDRVIPYFTRWMKVFPTVRVLAKAPLSDVLREWSGLGYNRRAKLLRDCAQAVVAHYGGKLPRDRASLESLPAIGPYTAGAIRAFAFDEREVFIETNIRAALIHHFFPRASKVPDTKLIPILEECMRRVTSSREWYSALMDYGSYIKKEFPNPSRRSAHHVKQSKFKGSLREARGMILKTLLQKKPSSSLPKTAQINTALQSLRSEGLIRKSGKGWKLSEK